MKQKPSIDEIEQLMDNHEDSAIEILPTGEVVVSEKLEGEKKILTSKEPNIGDNY